MLRALLVLALLGIGLAGPSHASMITSSAQINGPTVIDFEQFHGNRYVTGGPTQVGGSVGLDVVFTSTYGQSVLGDWGYGLASNGGWSGADAYTGLNTGTGSMTFTFNSGPVQSVGGFMNYAPGFGPDVLIEALATDGVTVLESYNLSAEAPISTPGGSDAGAFRGISRATADIGAFRVSNQYVVLDDLTFGGSPATNATPAPPALVLALTGVMGLGGYGWRRRKAAVTVG
ncbi:MAG: hypothetical protein J2P46_12455 [Zavarzinella sp.]|nr:hypothetical protein [Zavarzinella sp.]